MTARNVVHGVLAVILLWFSVYGLPAHRPSKVDGNPLPAPSGDLAQKAAPIGAALAGASAIDRAVWAEVWEKAARAVAAEVGAAEPVFTDTKSLRALTVVALEIAWRRVQGVTPDKYPKLRAAVEAFLADPQVIGRDEVTATDAVKRQYTDACHAIAWAGMNRG